MKHDFKLRLDPQITAVLSSHHCEGQGASGSRMAALAQIDKLNIVASVVSVMRHSLKLSSCGELQMFYKSLRARQASVVE